MAIARLVFGQTAGHHILAKLTYKINCHSMDTGEGSGEQDEEAPFHMLLEAEFST